MTFKEFIDIWDGKKLDVDFFPKEQPYQCVDLMHKYARDVIGDDLPTGNAYNVFVKGSDQYDKISYRNGLEPENGDVMFWGTEVGQYGHVAVFIEKTDNGFISFDQNWPLNTPCHKQIHNYSGVIGWLRSKKYQSNNDMTDEQLQMLANGQKAYDKLQEIEKGAKALRQRETDGAIFVDSVVAGKTVDELKGRIWADSTALAILMRVAGIPMISEEESRNNKYVKVHSARELKQ